MESKSIEVFKSDIKKIGNTVYESDDNQTCIICDVKTSNIEGILLREILSLYGYKITETRDKFIGGDDMKVCDIEFVTDMPWDEFNKLM